MNHPNRVAKNEKKHGCAPFLFLSTAGFFFILALLPWLFTSCQPKAMVPEELQEQPTQYQQTVEAAQQATASAGRQATSAVVIRPKETQSPIPTPEATISIVIVITTTANETKIANTDTPNEPLPSPTLDPMACALEEDEYVPATPSILNDIEDTLTAEQITTQLSQDAADSDFEDIEVLLTAEGIQITSNLKVAPFVTQEIEATGIFTVQQDSLRIVLYSITSAGVDITAQYCKSLQTRLNTSLYHLLPERYVQNFALYEGEIVVYSKIRP